MAAVDVGEQREQPFGGVLPTGGQGRDRLLHVVVGPGPPLPPSACHTAMLPHPRQFLRLITAYHGA
ncbi:hypothetical protein GCM10010532_040190 [Dactylosporangium siamense]|uniref:Uncharacterized protein n=1 Tax=Dactylosporangium siamense TaxID=685454 RepID=A0A919PVB6_9ACTN|nr:hypothetical protein Dsi01nite_072490 [Dactylosporangium siamense]